MSEELHILGLVVTAPPRGETALGEAIAQLPGSTVHAAQQGRLVVTIEAADTLLLTVPNQLGVEYNAHAIESILKYVAPELGWR